MSDDQFDAMLTTLSRARTRREIVAAIAATSAAGVFVAAAPAEAQGNGCRGVASRCQRDGQCCSGRCQKRRGKKNGRCRCSREGKRCEVLVDCCDGEDSLICHEGFCATGSD